MMPKMMTPISNGKSVSALKQNEILRSALRVIYTWASVPGALDGEHVRRLCEVTLGMKGAKR